MIKRWIEWAESRIRAVVVSEGLHVFREGVVQGPMTVTWVTRLQRPSPTALRKVHGLGPTLAQALGVPGVRIDDTARGILIEIPSPDPRTPAATWLADHTRGLGVAVGMNQWRRPIGVDLAHHPSVLFVGPSRKGKTQAMKSTLFALLASNLGAVKFAIFTKKREDWTAFEGLRGSWGVITDPDETEQALEWAAGTLMAERAERGLRTPPVVLVLDDLLNILQRAPGIADNIAEIASMGGGCGVFQLIGTQDAGSKRGTGGSGVEANITARIVYRSATATTAARATGAGGMGVDQLSGNKGDGLLIIDGEATRVATAYADDRMVMRLPAGGHVVAPWVRMVTRSEPVLSSSARTGQNGAERGRTGRSTPMAPPADAGTVADVRGTACVPDTPFLDTTRPPNAEERAQLRELFEALGSKEKVYAAAWGFKNGKVQRWLTSALEESDEDVSFDSLDLASEEGRARFEEMQRNGLIKLPDVAGLFIEGD